MGTLRGRDNTKLRSYGLDKCEIYGSLKEMKEDQVKDIINLLFQEELPCVTMDKYSLVKITSAGFDFLNRYSVSLAGAGNEQPVTLLMRSPKEKKTEDTGQGVGRKTANARRISEILTSRGLEMGARVSRTGMVYEDMYYTEDAQRMIVESFVTEDSF